MSKSFMKDNIMNDVHGYKWCTCTNCMQNHLLINGTSFFEKTMEIICLECNKKEKIYDFIDKSLNIPLVGSLSILSSLDLVL